MKDVDGNRDRDPECVFGRTHGLLNNLLFHLS
uniref:Uncharacterized protein n=1 Tax=Arundo donax TaxID=35708 RepID=A0A0A8XNZ5_ARUDO